jgi:hypothetical protein
VLQRCGGGGTHALTFVCVVLRRFFALREEPMATGGQAAAPGWSHAREGEEKEEGVGALSARAHRACAAQRQLRAAVVPFARGGKTQMARIASAASCSAVLLVRRARVRVRVCAVRAMSSTAAYAPAQPPIVLRPSAPHTASVIWLHGAATAAPAWAAASRLTCGNAGLATLHGGNARPGRHW